MQNHSLGIHVFPTKRSDAIRDNPSLLHFGSPHGTVKFKRFEEVSKNLGANCENKQVGQQKSELQQKKVQENAAPNLLKALELPKTLNLSENERKPSNSSKVGQKQTIISDPLALPDVSSKQSRKQDLENSPKSPNESESSFKEKQQAIAGVIHKGSFSQSAGDGHSFADGAAKAILKDLDIALESDEQMSIRGMRQHPPEKPLESEGLAGVNSAGSSSQQYAGARSAYKSMDDERQYEIKSNEDGTTISITDLSNQVIKELKEFTYGANSLKDFKRQQQVKIAEQEEEWEKKIARVKHEYTPEKFIDQTPEFLSGSTTPAPRWMREVLARKYAKEAAEEEEEKLRKEYNEWKEKRQFKPGFRKSKK